MLRSLLKKRKTSRGQSISIRPMGKSFNNSPASGRNWLSESSTSAPNHLFTPSRIFVASPALGQKSWNDCGPMSKSGPTQIELRSDRQIKMKRPPFRVGNVVAVCYVAGRDNPPGRRRRDNPFGSGPRGFLGLYLSRVEEARLSFWTFDTGGYDRAFKELSSKNHTVALESALKSALIHGAICYAVPFEQWRPYPISVTERRVLRRLRIKNEYEETRRSLAQVLHLARGSLYFSLDKFAVKLGQDPKRVGRPWFVVRPRSPSSIRRDAAERDEIYRDIEKKMGPQGHQPHKKENR